MAHKQKKDPFVPVFFLIGALLLGGTVFILISNLFNVINNNSVKGAEDNSRQVAIANASLKPIGNVTTTAEMPKGAAPVIASGSADGESIYKATCFACHGVGVAGAPMLGKKDQWVPRVANGLDALMNTALNGRGAMPARGGNPSLSDDAIRAAILYMTKESGFDLGGVEKKAKKAEPAAAPAAVAPAVVPAAVTPANEKEAIKAEPVAIEPEPAPAPASVAPVSKAVVKEVPITTPAEPAQKEPVAPTMPKPVAEPKKPEIPPTPATPTIPSAPVAPAPKEAAIDTVGQ